MSPEDANLLQFVALVILGVVTVFTLAFYRWDVNRSEKLNERLEKEND